MPLGENITWVKQNKAQHNRVIIVEEILCLASSGVPHFIETFQQSQVTAYTKEVNLQLNHHWTLKAVLAYRTGSSLLKVVGGVTHTS